MALAAELWKANEDVAQRILAHAFVRGLGDGTLPVDSFRSYVAQDAYFLEAFARAYALCLAGSTTRADLDAFAGLIGGVVEELKLHAGYAARLGIDMAGVAEPLHPQRVHDFVQSMRAVTGVQYFPATLAGLRDARAHLARGAFQGQRGQVVGGAVLDLGAHHRQRGQAGADAGPHDHGHQRDQRRQRHAVERLRARQFVELRQDGAAALRLLLKQLHVVKNGLTKLSHSTFTWRVLQVRNWMTPTSWLGCVV